MTAGIRIDRIELRLLPLRLRERFEISSGAWQDRTIFIVTVHGEGEVGWGECVAAEDPSYSYETTETAWHLTRDFIAPRVVGRKIASAADFSSLIPGVRGHPMAVAGVEMALWDLQARLEGRPLAALLAEGRAQPRAAVDVGVSIGLQPDVPTLLDRVGSYVAQGYQRVKMKIKPGRDVELLAAVREHFTDLPIFADANSAYTLADLDHLKTFDALDLMMIEQPLAWDDVQDHAELARHVRTPICLDESITSSRAARLAIDLEACSIINLKPGRVGGFTESLAIHDRCRERGIGLWCGGMLESGIGRTHNVALASLPGFSLPGDLSESRRYWHEDLIDPEFEMIEGGRLAVPDGVGIGVEPRHDFIRERTVRHEVVR
jgi:O-succinylbenzoate synthase